jgi:hypothetical protein
MTPLERLKKIAVAQTSSQDFLRLNKPAWQSGFGWERFVEEEIRDLWDELSEEARVVAYIQAHWARWSAPDRD